MKIELFGFEPATALRLKKYAEHLLQNQMTKQSKRKGSSVDIIGGILKEPYIYVRVRGTSELFSAQGVLDHLRIAARLNKNIRNLRGDMSAVCSFRFVRRNRAERPFGIAAEHLKIHK